MAQAMAKRLMHCYGELRQLEALLESLILSLGKPGCLPAATAIICNPGTLAALHAVCPPRFSVSNEANAFRAASCCKVALNGRVQAHYMRSSGTLVSWQQYHSFLVSGHEQIYILYGIGGGGLIWSILVLPESVCNLCLDVGPRQSQQRPLVALQAHAETSLFLTCL